MPTDSMLGAGVLAGIAIVVAIMIFNKGKNSTQVDHPISTQVVRVIDGDTIELNSEIIRLYGIDAPEMGQPCKRNNSPYDCGIAAKEHLKFILTGTKVKCTMKGKDKWGRYIGKCTADGEDISKLMVKHGWALAYRQYSSEYVKDEEFAKLNKLGMWSKEFSLPSDWRKSNKEDKL